MTVVEVAGIGCYAMFPLGQFPDPLGLACASFSLPSFRKGHQCPCLHVAGRCCCSCYTCRIMRSGSTVSLTTVVDEFLIFFGAGSCSLGGRPLRMRRRLRGPRVPLLHLAEHVLPAWHRRRLRPAEHAAGQRRLPAGAVGGARGASSGRSNRLLSWAEPVRDREIRLQLPRSRGLPMFGPIRALYTEGPTRM